MIMFSRILVGLGGLLFAAIGLGLWFNTLEAAQNVGLMELAAVGRGTVRADIAGFFLAGAILQLLAAVQLNRALLWPVQMLLALAFAGRVVTLVLDGPIAAHIPSMGVELVLMLLLFWAKRVWTPREL